MSGSSWVCRPILRRRAVGRALAAAAALLLGAVSPGNAQAPQAPQAPKTGAAPATGAPIDVADAVHVCSSCHGPGGRSISSTFPRLAGQQKDYLEAQLKAFRDHTRADPHAKTYMWGMAARLSDAVIAGIAAHYSSQPAVPGEPDNSAYAALGRKIFTEGIPARSVPPCQGCHGDHAEGNAVIPRLAGQHRAYIEAQLQAFAANTRANEIMHENSKNLTPDEIREVAAYLRTQ